MTFEPKQKNKAPEVTVAALFICASVAYASSAVEVIPGRGMLQFVALALFCAMIFVFIRYKMTFFRYSVGVSQNPKKSLHREEDEEEKVPQVGGISYEDALSLPVTAVPPEMLELRIERRQGKGAWVTECLLKLTDIQWCYSLPEEEEACKKALLECRRCGKYKYFRNLAISDMTVLYADSPGGKVVVYLEKDAKLFEYLRAVSAYNKDNIK